MTCFRRCRVCRVTFSYFALPDMFSAVPRASSPVFMFCPPGFVFGGNEGVGSRFHVLRSRIRFGRYRGRWVPFSCFARPDSFSAVPRATAPGLIFCGIEGVSSRFHGLRSQTHFQRYRGRRVLFSCFARPDSFFGGIEGVRSRLHVLRSMTCFRRCRVCRVTFSCFALPDMFSAVPRASSPVFMFCPPGFIFDGNEGAGSRFHVLRSRSRFPQYRGHRVPSSSFCSPELILGGTEGVGSRFHVLRARTHFRRYRGRRLPASFSAVSRV
jgi:hypothetical protein